MVTRARSMVPVAAATVLAGHGLIHLMGAALLWQLGEPGELRYSDVSPAPGTTGAGIVGGLWLFAAALFIAATIMMPLHRPWLPVASVAALLSLAVLLPSAGMAAVGLIMDIVVLVVGVTLWRRRSVR